MPFKSEKQKRFFYSRAAGKPPKKGDGDISQEAAQKFIEDAHGEVIEKSKKPRFSKIMDKMKKSK
jgi:hypothetical protein